MQDHLQDNSPPKATLFPNFLPYGCFAYNYFSISCNSFLKIQKKALFFSEKLR